MSPIEGVRSTQSDVREKVADNKGVMHFILPAFKQLSLLDETLSSPQLDPSQIAVISQALADIEQVRTTEQAQTFMGRLMKNCLIAILIFSRAIGFVKKESKMDQCLDLYQRQNAIIERAPEVKRAAEVEAEARAKILGKKIKIIRYLYPVYLRYKAAKKEKAAEKEKADQRRNMMLALQSIMEQNPRVSNYVEQHGIAAALTHFFPSCKKTLAD